MQQRRRAYVIRDPEQLRALASPVRQELLNGLRACGPCTVAELAAHVGRPAESLYYHVRELVRVGLMVEVERRPTERREESVYGLVSDQLRIEPRPKDPEAVALVQKIGRGILRHAERLNDRGVAERRRRTGGRRELTLGQRTLRLDARGLSRVNAKVDELLRLLDDVQSDSGNVYTLTLALAPNPARDS